MMDFVFVVWQGVVGLVFVVFQYVLFVGLVEVDVVGQFVDDEDVQFGDYFWFQVGGCGQLWIEDGWMQVGEQVQL